MAHENRQLVATAGTHDWVLIYYMSYDNNLGPCGPVILKKLEKGVKESQLVVTVLSDDTGEDGLKRYAITAKGTTTETLKRDDKVKTCWRSAIRWDRIAWGIQYIRGYSR